MKNCEIYLRLALKAQNQCRMTLETLATIKNPPAVFAKQANIAHGPQQVNNGAETLAPAREEKTIQSNELITNRVQHGRHCTTEEQERQGELIQKWQPWKKSTGPKTPKGKAKSANKAYKHGYDQGNGSRKQSG
jgi:hypothetical protein